MYKKTNERKTELLKLEIKLAAAKTAEAKAKAEIAAIKAQQAAAKERFLREDLAQNSPQIATKVETKKEEVKPAAKPVAKQTYLPATPDTQKAAKATLCCVPFFNPDAPAEVKPAAKKEEKNDVDIELPPLFDLDVNKLNSTAATEVVKKEETRSTVADKFEDIVISTSKTNDLEDASNLFSFL